MRMYERLSRVYDLDWGGVAGQYFELIDGLLSECGTKRARVLDLACGSGTLAVELARRGHLVHGIDISPEMIRLARSKSIGLSNVSFDVQDMTRFSDGAVEVHRQRPYDLADLEPLLGDAGMRLAGAFSGFDFTPYSPESERLICVAERTAAGSHE